MNPARYPDFDSLCSDWVKEYKKTHPNAIFGVSRESSTSGAIHVYDACAVGEMLYVIIQDNKVIREVRIEMTADPLP